MSGLMTGVMKMSNGKSLLAEALSKAQAEFPVIEKNRVAKIPTKDGRSYSYKYADLTDVVNAIRPFLTKNGLAFSQGVARTESGEVLRTTLLHAGGESIYSEVPFAAAQGSGPQAVGSALTYARRYGLSALLGIVTDEDDDAQSAERVSQPIANERGRGMTVPVSGPPPATNIPSPKAVTLPYVVPAQEPVYSDDAIPQHCGADMRVTKPEYLKADGSNYWWCPTCKAKAGRM